MESNQSIEKSTLYIDSHELLIRFLQKCKNYTETKKSRAQQISSCADIVTAVHFYRKYPSVNDFIEKYLKERQNYFQLQWARSIWSELSTMKAENISEIVIKQINLVDNLEEEE